MLGSHSCVSGNFLPEKGTAGNAQSLWYATFCLKRMNEISGLIKFRRRELGLSQDTVAEIAGISIRTVQDAESSQGSPSWNTLQSLFQALSLKFELSPAYLDQKTMVNCGVLPGERKAAPTRQALIRTLPAFCRIVMRQPWVCTDEQKLALKEFVSTLKYRRPKMYRKYFLRSSVDNYAYPQHITERVDPTIDEYL